MIAAGELRYRTCSLCDAMCGLAVTVDGGAVTQIRGDADDVFSRGHMCPKGAALRELHEDPDRLRSPMRRTAGGWEAVPWDEALDEAATRLAAVSRAHGTDAVAMYSGNPMANNHGGALGVQALLAALGTHNRFDANSQDSNPKIFAAMQMYGDGLSITVPDIDRVQHVLMLGANPAVSMGSVMSLGDVRARLRGVRERGGRIVLLDPRRTETAALCDEHHFLRPGSDAALLLAMLHTLFAERRVDIAALRMRATGIEALAAAARRFAPERVEDVTGVPASVIRRLARELTAPSSIVYARVGLCQSEHGVLASWLVEALNVVTGNFDVPGGMMFASPAVDIGPIARVLLGNAWGRWRSRVRGLPELAGSLPSAAMIEEMETPGAGQVRALVTFAGDPVLSTPNGPRLGRALAGLEFMVSVDPYVNATTRHAHLVLPPVSALERSHFALLMHSVAVRNSVKYSEAVLPAAEGALDDYAILTELAVRVAGKRLSAGTAGRALTRVLRAATPSADAVLDALLRAGTYGDRFGARPGGLTLAKVRAAPHGLDLGALRRCGPEKVRMPRGRVELAPEVYLRALPGLERWVAAPRAPLVLIGRRHLRAMNSWLHNVASLVKGPDRSGLLVHPDDARERGVVDGSPVRVETHVGSVTVRAKVTDDVMRGVVSLPHGYGHGAAPGGPRIASTLGGANVNVLTDETRVEAILGDSILTGVPVTVAPG